VVEWSVNQNFFSVRMDPPGLAGLNRALEQRCLTDSFWAVQQYAFQFMLILLRCDLSRLVSRLGAIITRFSAIPSKSGNSVVHFETCASW
jgi:hypothetical protein